MLSSRDTEFRHVPPQRHSKNVLESRHSSIRNIFRRLRKHDGILPLEIATQRALRIPNDLYGPNIISAFEMTHGFTRLIGDTINRVTHNWSTRRTYSLHNENGHVLSSSVFHDESVAVGDIFDVFVKQHNRKRWSRRHHLFYLQTIQYLNN